MKFGVIGYGYWGPNVVRNLWASMASRTFAFRRYKSCGTSSGCAKPIPGCQNNVERNGCDLSPEIDAVAIVSPVWTHYELTKAALLERKARLC